MQKFLKKHTFIDYVIHGEGEKVFLDLVESFENNNTKEVSGISWLDKFGIYQSNSEFRRIRELECIPSPYLSGIFDRLIEAYPKNEWLILWETNRGVHSNVLFVIGVRQLLAKLINLIWNV